MEHPIQNGGSCEEEMEGESIESGSENASIHEIEDGNSSNEELSLRTRKYKSELRLIASKHQKITVQLGWRRTYSIHC